MSDRTREYTEVEHGGDASDLHAVGILIEPHVRGIMRAIHSTDVIAPGEQWTLPVLMSCGFQAEIVIRVASVGTCRPLVSARTPGGR